MSYAAREIQVKIDGTLVLTVANGGTADTEVLPGDHLVQFCIGNKPIAKYGLSVQPDKEHIDIVCEVSASGGIDAFSTSPGVLAPMNSAKSGSSVMSGVVGAVIVLLVLGFIFYYLLFRVTFVFQIG